MRVISLFIFDLDGTLVDTLDDITSSVNFALGRLGRPPLPAVVVRGYVGDGITTLMQRCLGGSAGQLDEAVALYKNHHRNNLVVRSALYPAVSETLKYFQPVPMAVISNKSVEFIQPLLDGLGIGRYFRTIIGADSGLLLKPAPDALLKVMHDINAPKERTVMVGDGAADVASGKAAGVITCSVTYGFRSAEELEKTGPDYLIHDFSELKRLFAPGRPE